MSFPITTRTTPPTVAAMSWQITVETDGGRGGDGRAPAGRPAARRAVLAGMAVVVLSVGVGAVAMWSGREQPAGSAGTAATSTSPTATHYATLAGMFGGKGTGPGQLDDARSVAVAPDGSVWVGDYSDGRVQQFDAGGRFRRLITMPPDEDGDPPTVYSLAADGHGHLYVAAGGSVFAYAAATGGLLWRFTPKYPEGGVDEVVVDANGVLFGLVPGPETDVLTDELIRFSSTGKPQKRWPHFISKANKKDSGMDVRLAIDGLGRFFVLSEFENRVYCYDANGTFTDAFGEHGDLPGQLSTLEAITADGHGALYIINDGHVDKFTLSGRYVDTLPTDYDDGSPSALAIDRQDVLYVLTREKVKKYRLAND